MMDTMASTVRLNVGTVLKMLPVIKQQESVQVDVVLVGSHHYVKKVGLTFKNKYMDTYALLNITCQSV